MVRDVADVEVSEANVVTQEVHKIPKKCTKKKKQQKGIPDNTEEEKHEDVDAEENDAIEKEKISKITKSKKDKAVHLKTREPVVPNILKLKKEQIEIKEIKPQKLKIEEKSDEIPLFATIKLKKTSIPEKKEIKPATQLQKVLLKSKIDIIPYPPDIKNSIYTDINAVVDNGILSRNCEEAMTIKKKKVKKVNLPEIEPTELDKYTPYTLEKNENDSGHDLTLLKVIQEPKTAVKKDGEIVPLKLGKGNIPHIEDTMEHVALKKVKKVDILKSESIIEAPLTTEQLEKIKKPTEDNNAVVLQPLNISQSSLPTDNDLYEPKEVEQIDKVNTEEIKPKKGKKKTNIPETKTEEKKIELGKPKPVAPINEEDVELKYKQKEVPNLEPEDITLKPFKKEPKLKDTADKDLKVEQLTYSDAILQPDDIKPKEFDSKDKRIKKTNKKIVPNKIEDIKSQTYEEIDQDVLPLIPKDNNSEESVIEGEKSKAKIPEKLKLMRIEKQDQKATKLKIEDVKPQELFSTVKLRKASTVTIKDHKPLEVQKVLLKSRIKHVAFPPQEQIPVVTILPKVEIDKGILARNYEEASKIKKPKHKKVKLSEPEELQLEKFEPSPLHEKPTKEVDNISFNLPNQNANENKYSEEDKQIKLGKGNIPSENSEVEEISLKKIPEKETNITKIVDTVKDDKPLEVTVKKGETMSPERQITPLLKLDIKKPTREIENLDKLTENVKLTNVSKKDKDDSTTVDISEVASFECEIPKEGSDGIIDSTVVTIKTKPKKDKVDNDSKKVIRRKKPSITSQVEVPEENVVIMNLGGKPYITDDISENITIKKDVPHFGIEEEHISEQFVLRKNKPSTDEISEEFVVKSVKPSIYPKISQDAVEELLLKKQPYHSEDISEELTITKEVPISKITEKSPIEDSERMVVVVKKTEKPYEETEQFTIKPRRRSSIRKPSIEEHPEERFTLKQRRPSEEILEEEVSADITFKPKVTKPKEEIDQEFKISLQTYQEEDISMSGKVRLPRKKKSLPIDEANAEVTIHKEVVIDKSQDYNIPLRRKSSVSVYNIEDIEQEFQLGIRQQHRSSIVYEEESLDIKVKRKPSKPTIPVFNQESASLLITNEEEIIQEGDKIIEKMEGDVLFSICSYVAENEEALNLVEGERVYVLENTNQDWWFVQKHLTEEKGWVPAVYLRDEPSYTLYVQKKLHEKIDKLPVFEKPNNAEEVYAPRFVEKLQPKHVPDGATFQFECQVEGNPRPQITWFRQTAIIKPSPDFQIFYDDDNVATLIIREIFPEDAGTFTCVAKNTAGFASSTTELTVEAPLSDHGSDITGLSRKSLSRESSLADILEGIPPTFSRKPKAKIVKEGETVELECRLVAVPEPEVTWFYKGKPVKDADNVTVTTQSDMHMYSTIVSINKVKKTQEGMYQVVAENREGQATLDIILKVKTGQPEPPEIVEPLQDVCISEGESAVLATQITGKPVPKIVWCRDGKPDSSLQTKTQGETHSLTLIKPSPSDSARYSVMATNKHGTAQTSCQLTVEGIPGPQAPLFVERFEEQVVKEKGTIRLVAKVTGNPVPMITWFRNNKTLLASLKQTQLFDGENIILEIKDADSEEDAGDYKCVASNTLGVATHGGRVRIDVDKVSFTKLLQEYVELNETETVTLECETSHTVTTKWQLNGIDLSGMDHRELVQEGRSHRLIIKRANLNDAGIYTCSVKDQLTSCSVVVHGIKPDFVRKLEDAEVKEQEVAILEVEISSETADVVWVKDGLPVEPIAGKIEIENKGNIRKLLIRSTSVHDEGEYTCTLGDQECTAEVTVIELPPQIHINMQDVSVTKGEKATLEVELTKGDALVRWFKDDKELHFSEHVQLSIDGKKQKLKIYQAELSDGGVYSCRVGDQPNQVSTARVTVDEPAVEFITKLPDVTVASMNSDIELKVELSQAVPVKWLKKGKEIKDSSKYAIANEGTIQKLIIKNATTEDQSDITCTAVNVKTSTKLKVEKLKIAPKIMIDSTQTDYKIKKGEDVNIEVKFKASPTPVEEWFVNGSLIQKNKKIDYVINEDSATLTLKKVEESDGGIYTIRLKNSIGEASAEMNLIVMQVPGEPGAPEFLEVTDTAVILHWKPPMSDGNSPITRYILEFHDKEEFLEWHEVNDTITTTTHNVKNLTHNTELMFRVAAQNEIGKGPNSQSTKYVRITVPVTPEPPTIQERLQDSVVGYKKTVTLKCVIGGTPLPEVKWFRNGKPLKSKKQAYDNRVATFTLQDCTETSAGTYSCKATNPAGSAETTCKLLVQDTPKLEVAETVQNQSLNISEQWKPEVTFSGYPRPEIIWERNGQRLNESDKRCKIFIDEATTTIAIYSVERADSANYTVRAANAAGSASAVLVLKVVDKPGKPEGPITFSNITAESITVEWRPPIDDGGLDLTKYVLEKCEASKQIWTKAGDIDPQSTCYTVQKLLENNEYMFRVLAQNTAGASEFLSSEAVVVRTIYNKPSPPQGPLEVSGMTETSCTISWHAPMDDGGTPIIDYTVSRKESSKKSWQMLGTVSELSLSMSDLTLNTAYVFKIIARNKEGDSNPYASEDPIVAGRKITPPSAPLNFNAITITSKSVTLQWAPPSSTGGTELTGYIIEKQYGDSKKWSKVVTLDPGNLQYCVENLKEKSELYFRIYAENSIGLSTAAATSIISLKTHATVPSPPTDPLEIRSLGPNAIIVEWGVPETDGGAPLEGYKVVIRDVKKTMWMEVGQVSAEVQKLTIKDLQENHEYLVRIFARNEVGLSDPLESDEPFQVKKPTDMEEADIEELSLLEKDTPSLSFSTETTTSWMREAGMDADIHFYAKGSLLRRSEYFFRIWYYAKHLFK